MENNTLKSIHVKNSNINTKQENALTTLLMCADKERLIETINKVMMLDFINEISKQETEDLIILLLFLEDI